MKRILVLNLGSTSFKFKLFEWGIRVCERASGEIQNIGGKANPYRFESGGQEEEGTGHDLDHEGAFLTCYPFLIRCGQLQSLDNIDAVGYKAVHGGSYDGSQLVDDNLLAEMEKMSSLAPAHNPVYIKVMRQIRDRFPQLVQIACFETAFHATIPECRTVYGVPYAWKEQYGIRRYGFHGSSHAYSAEVMKERDPDAKRLIALHLGGSSSLCAIRNGKSIACSMGATPQSGIFQNNRVGDFDVFCLPELIRQYHNDWEKVFSVLSSEGGLLGVSGISNDMRKILEAVHSGHQRAQLTVEAYIDGIVGYTGMFTAFLGGLDALVFTGGIGKNSSIIRSGICDKLAFLPVKLDPEKNRKSGEGKISADDSPVRVWCLTAQEERMVARQTAAWLQEKMP
jgi:acetate kinase